MFALLTIVQFAALVELIRRLLPGRTRKPPVLPALPVSDTSVSVIVAALNEAARIGPCLRGLAEQRQPLEEILVVDSRSTDGTREMVEHAKLGDSRFRLLTDDPLPSGWVGKVWALQHGLHAARGEWVLGIDADTEPEPGMVAGIIEAARLYQYDVVSFSPRFGEQSAAEQLIQPSMLRTLLYRTGAAGAGASGERVLANGQCFLARRETLMQHGGYSAARTSFADDVTLARSLAAQGARVGFLDGSKLYTVRSYQSVGEMWREWGRSIDLRDATTTRAQWLDIGFLVAAQGLPVIVLTAFAVALMKDARALSELWPLALVNTMLLSIHVLMLQPLAQSYSRRHFTYWLSWFTDPLAVLRVVISSAKQTRVWRGRAYPERVL